MWARIESDRVAEITDIDPVGRFHPSLVWLTCGAEVQPGWSYENGVFFEPESLVVNFVPVSVTRAQGKSALIQLGLWKDVVDYVASIEDATQKSIAEVALNDTTHWQRSSPFLNAAAQALGLTDKQLDQLFIDASKIEL